jgi:hypothetical protein
MEGGVYFDAWFPLQHDYHPSFPPRRLRMIDHLQDYRATMTRRPAGGCSTTRPPAPSARSGSPWSCSTAAPRSWSSRAGPTPP